MLLNDFRYAARSLRRAPGFAAAVVLSLALGAGVNITIFSLINAAFIKPLPYPDPERLVSITTTIPKLSQLGRFLSVKAGVVLKWRNELQSVESIGAAMGRTLTLSSDAEAETLGAVAMTAEFLEVLGAKPQLGRWFSRAEEENGAPNVVILSDALWRHRFSADPGVLGRAILLDAVPYRVVGITPAAMPFPRVQLPSNLPKRVDLFIPLRLSNYDRDLTSNVVEAECVTLGRLKPAVTLQALRAELEVSMAGLSRTNRRRLEMHAHAEPLQSALVGDSGNGLVLLSVAVGFVLLIVCVNVANLILIRATGKRRELAVRAALGATSRNLLSASAAESVLLAVSGISAGLLLAWWILDAIRILVPARLPGVAQPALDNHALVFAIVLGALTAILFGLLPGWRLSRIMPLAWLPGSRVVTDSPKWGRTRTALVTVEVALGTVLLIGAGLLLSSLERILQVRRGFEVDNIVAVDLSVPEVKYRTFEQKLSFFRRVQEALAPLPVIHHVSYADGIPLAPPSGGAFAVLEGRQNEPWEEKPIANWWQVGAAYFSTMGVSLISGRPFQDAEDRPVAVVSETAAQRLWPGENPIGKRLRHPIDPDKFHWFRVVGVARDVRDQRLDREPSVVIYVPYWQAACCRVHTEALTLVARSPLEPDAIAKTIREQVWNIDRQVAVPDVSTMQRVVSDSLADRRFNTAMLTAFALIALLLAAMGIYGVLAYTVAERRPEIGIRMALGARPDHIRSLMLREGMKPVAIGLVLGMGGAVVLTRFIAALLFNVGQLDPFTFLAVPLLLFLLAMLACYLPSREAAAVDPLATLRQQ